MFQISAQHPETRHFNYNSGMPGDELYGSIIDKDGFLWFYGDGGLSVYNGFSFKKNSVAEGLPDNTIFELVQDHKERIWTRTFSGKIAYILNDSIYDLPCNKSLLNEIPKGSYVSSLICDANDVLWLGLTLSSKVIKISPPYNADNIETIDFGITGRYVMQIGNDFLYGTGSNMTANQLEFILNDKTKQTIPFTKNTSNKNADTRFLKISTDYWLLGIDNALFVFKNGKLIKQFDVSGYIVSISKAKNKYWIGVYQGGVYQLDDRLEHLSKTDYYPENTISKVIEDGEGGLWIDNLEKGAYYIPDENIFVYNTKEGLPEKDIACSYKSNDVFIAGTKTGDLYKWSSGIFEKVDNESTRNSYFSFTGLKHDRILACSAQPHFIDHTNKNWKFSYSKNPNIKRAEYIKEKDVLVCVNQNSLLFVDPESEMVYKNYRTPFRIHSMAVKDSSEIYLGLANGLYKYANDTIAQISFKDHKINERVTAIVLADNWIISGTNGWGIKANNGIRTEVVTESNGLVSNVIRCMLRIGDQLIIGTNKGLQQFRIGEHIQKGTSLNVADGLPSNEIKYIEHFNDTLYITTPEGIARIPVSLFDDKISVPVFTYIHGFSNGKLLSVDSINRIEDQKSKINFSFSIPYFKNSGKQIFRYRLTGWDNEWIVTTDNSISFNSLPAGSYVLQLAYLHKEKGWIESPVTFRFKVEKYFWQTWWFISMCIVLLVILIAFIFYLYYNKRLAKAKKEIELSKRIANTELKALRSQMNPHFIFNALNSIQNYILKNDPISAHKFLGRFSKLIRNILEQSVFDVVTVHHEIETLKLYVELECLRMNFNFEYTFETDNVHLNMEEKIPSMLIQPYIENAIWHGLANKEEDRKLFISIKNEIGYSVKCIIRDNGVGREKAKEIKEQSEVKRKSLGLDITGDRIDLVKKLYGKTIEVTVNDLMSANGASAGTEIILTIPFINERHEN